MIEDDYKQVEQEIDALAHSSEQATTQAEAKTETKPVDIDRNRAEIAYRLLERGIMQVLQSDTSDIDDLKANLRTCLDDTYKQYMKAMADDSSWWLL